MCGFEARARAFLKHLRPPVDAPHAVLVVHKRCLSDLHGPPCRGITSLLAHIAGGADNQPVLDREAQILQWLETSGHVHIAVPQEHVAVRSHLQSIRGQTIFKVLNEGLWPMVVRLRAEQAKTSCTFSGVRNFLANDNLSLTASRSPQMCSTLRCPKVLSRCQDCDANARRGIGVQTISHNQSADKQSRWSKCARGRTRICAQLSVWKMMKSKCSCAGQQRIKMALVGTGRTNVHVHANSTVPNCRTSFLLCSKFSMPTLRVTKALRSNATLAISSGMGLLGLSAGAKRLRARLSGRGEHPARTSAPCRRMSVGPVATSRGACGRGSAYVRAFMLC